MRLAIVVTSTAAAILAMISTVSAQNDLRESRATTAAAAASTNAGNKDVATGSVPGLVTPAQEEEMPYHACINARGWVNGRLVCSESFSTAGQHLRR
jgi:hypothetical protein